MARQAQRHRRDDEAAMRLTAPQHITESLFSRHEAVEGYFEIATTPGFQKSDRLLKIETVYGTIQLGYNPRLRQSFIFATNKSSIFGTAAALHQRQMADYQMMRSLRSGTQNLAYTARRRQDSAVILYKMETLPWSHRTIAPYLDRADMGTLSRTMPFLDARAEQARRQELAAENRQLQQDIRAGLARGQGALVAQARAGQVAASALQDHTSALLYRKATQSKHFFRRLNMAFDLQKQEMFAYYRNLRQGIGTGYETPEPAEKNKGEDEDE